MEVTSTPVFIISRRGGGFYSLGGVRDLDLSLAFGDWVSHSVRYRIDLPTMKWPGLGSIGILR